MNRDLFPVRVLVPLSGGKDSQACLKLACETYSPTEVRALFCDTQWEHPLTYAHIKKLRGLYGDVQVDVVTAGSVPDQVRKHGQFPVAGARFCTEELKIWPTKRYAAALAIEQGSRIQNKKKRISASTAGGFEVWYGMRSDESHDRKTRYAGKVCDEVYWPHEVLRKYPQYLGKLGVRFRLPVLHWSTADVFSYLGGHPKEAPQSEANPLYEWFDRCGCFPCLASGDDNKERSFAHDATGAERKVITIQLAEETGKSPWTSKGGKARNEACALVCGD